ncbi:MAG TPA: GTP cyclohydrolase II [Actinopolymorphaceae bacterium]|nr:GTP cyclohydrolase II [Actinopolymorphaceae bacterium]
MTAPEVLQGTGMRQVVRTRLPTMHGEFTAYGYETDSRSTTIAASHRSEHIALVHGDLSAAADSEVLVRVHSECLTGDVFGSQRCDCGAQLHAALGAVVAAGVGIVVYLRGHEGRGIGLVPKLAAYALQDVGHDTIDANLALGLPGDARDYAAGAAILTHLRVRRIRLLTNNPAKAAGLRRHGVVVSRCEPLVVPANPENASYLETKRLRFGHLLPTPTQIPHRPSWSEAEEDRLTSDQ